MKGELETLQNKQKALDEVDQIDKRLKEIEQDPAQQAELEQLQSKRKSLSEEHDFSDASIARQQGKTKRAIKRKHKQLQDLNQKLQLKRSKGQYEGPSREDLLMQKDSAKAQKRELKGKIDSAQGEAEQHRAKENALKEEVSAIGVKQKQNSESLDTERKRIAAQGRKDTTTDNWNMASSGRMTGGTGSAWGGALRSLWDYVSGTGEKEKSPEEQKTLEEEAKAKAKEKFENITKSQKQLENLVDLLPPVSFTELANAKAKAVEAYERYEGFHNDAYKAFIAEQTVVNVSAQTKALAESGKPVQDEITRQGAPLQEAITKTTQRDSVLQQGNTEVGENKEDTGIIALLIEKIASHSDDFNNQPQAGGDGSDAINKGVESSKEQSKQQKEDSLKESEQQRTILDEAITLRATKQQEVDQNITDLNAKHEAEQSILQEIRVEKAQRLSQREAARAEVESHAQTFNVGIQQIQVWSTEYKAKRSETK